MSHYSAVLSLNIWSILLLFGALHGYFLAVVFYKKGWTRGSANRIFAGFLTAVSYILTIAFLHESRLMVYLPHLLATSTPMLYLLGPFLYLYVRSLLEKNFAFNWKTLIHTVPFVICVLTIVPFYSESSAFKIEYLRQAAAGPVDLPMTRAIYYGLALIQNIIYWHLIYRIIESRRKKTKTYIDRWLTRAHFVYGSFLIGFTVVLGIFIFTDFYLREIRYGGYLLLSLSVHMYGYYLLQESRPVEKRGQSRKYDSTDPGAEKIDALKQQLTDLVESSEMYLNRDLKLEDLAGKLQVPSHHISQVINTEFDANFNEFINKYRVARAKELLRSERYDAYSLEGIALEAGFNNRTSFYRVFKKYTGMTPSGYKQNYNDR